MADAAPEYLIVTNRRDLTSDYIVREMKRRGLPYYRLNTETISSHLISCDPTSDRFELQRGRRKIAIEKIKAAYFRRPEPPLLDGVVDAGEKEYCRGEWLSLLKSLYLLLDDRWLSHPNAILLAEDKLRQLRLASKVGFLVPDTFVSNGFAAVTAFTSSDATIGKPLRHAVINRQDGERVIFTNRVVGPTPDDEAAISAAPAIYQREVSKRLDVRVTVVGGRVFSVGIDSQSTPETSVDWRFGTNARLKHEILILPNDIELACVQIVREQQLKFGAIDLILDRHGLFWFLECNPNGQWAWIENRTGLPIAAAIVDELEEIAKR